MERKAMAGILPLLLLFDISNALQGTSSNHQLAAKKARTIDDSGRCEKFSASIFLELTQVVTHGFPSTEQ